MDIKEFLSRYEVNDRPGMYGYENMENGTIVINDYGFISFDSGTPVLSNDLTSIAQCKNKRPLKIRRLGYCEHANNSPKPLFFILDDGRWICPQCAISLGKAIPADGNKYSDIGSVVTEVELRKVKKFGIEIEVAFWDSRPFEPYGYHARANLHKPWPSTWRGEYDRSIDDDGGIEFISPPMWESKYALGSLVTIEHLFLETDAAISSSTGIHVHIDKGEIEPKAIYSVAALMEEFVYAAGGSAQRYTNNRYAPPLKKPQAHRGHYIAVNQTRRTWELRMFRSSTELLGLLMPVAIAQGLIKIAELDVIPPIAIKRNDLIGPLVQKQWEYWTEYLGWFPGGEWRGWMYNPDCDDEKRRVTVTSGKQEYSTVLPGTNDVLGHMERRIEAFIDSIGKCTVQQAIDGGSCV